MVEQWVLIEQASTEGAPSMDEEQPEEHATASERKALILAAMDRDH
jgi:hypothetical protein